MILYCRETGKRMRNGAEMAKAGAINVFANRAVAGTTAMTRTGANDTLARPPVD